jgi:flavodoxin
MSSRAIVIYESLTGNTEKAAGFIGENLVAAGISTTVCPTTTVDFQALADADLVIVGSWTDGLFLFGQKPARSDRLSQLPFMTGKRGAVFCTYAIETGKTLQKLEDILRDRGADVIGGLAIKRNKLEQGSREFVDRLLGSVTV